MSLFFEGEQAEAYNNLQKQKEKTLSNIKSRHEELSKAISDLHKNTGNSSSNNTATTKKLSKISSDLDDLLKETVLFFEGEQAEAYKAKKTAEKEKDENDDLKRWSRRYAEPERNGPHDLVTGIHPTKTYERMLNGKGSNKVEKEYNNRSDKSRNASTYKSGREADKMKDNLKNNWEDAYDAADRHERRHPQAENAFLAEACDKII